MPEGWKYIFQSDLSFQAGFKVLNALISDAKAELISLDRVIQWFDTGVITSQDKFMVLFIVQCHCKHAIESKTTGAPF